MTTLYQWEKSIAFWVNWKRKGLSLMIIATLLYSYDFLILSEKRRHIVQQKIDIAQQESRISQHTMMFHQLAMANQQDFSKDEALMSITQRFASERLQQLFKQYDFIPESWENEDNLHYKMSFILPYSRVLQLLEQLSLIGFTFTSIHILPMESSLLSVQFSLTDLNVPSSSTGKI